MKERFEKHVDEAMVPDDYPGDEAMVSVTDEDVEKHGVDPVAEAFIPARVRWAISDRDGAAWALRRYRKATRTIEEVAALAQRLRDEADEWERDATVDPLREVGFFGEKLREWHAGEIVGQKSKTVKLPGGRLKGRVGGVSTTFDDVEAAVAWLDEHAPDLVKRPPAPLPTPDAAGVKKAFGGKVDDEAGEYPAVDEHGEIVPGVKLVRGVAGFDVDLDETETF